VADEQQQEQQQASAQPGGEKQQQAGAETGGEKQQAGQQGAPAKVEFSPEQQAHIDSLITERVKRAEAAAEKRIKEEAAEAARRAQMDESERLQAEKADAEKRAAEADERADRALIDAEARVAALTLGAKPERVARILKLIDLGDVAVTDGAADEAAVKRAVEALKEELPELFAASAGPGRSGAEMGGTGKASWTRAQIAALARDPKAYAEHEAEIDAALAEGRIVD